MSAAIISLSRNVEIVRGEGKPRTAGHPEVKTTRHITGIGALRMSVKRPIIASNSLRNWGAWIQ